MSVAADFSVELGELRLEMQLDVEAGERVAIVGPNGTGKTTLLRVLAGLQPIDSGVVRIDGRVVDDPTVDAFNHAQDRGVGYCPQELALFAHMNALENVAFGLRAHGHSKSQAHERARELLRQIELSQFVDSLPSSMSQGQCQRVAIVRALASSNQLVLLDEPTSAIDVQSRDAVHGLINAEVRRTGATLIVVTHDRDEAAELADRVIDIGA